jgi:hypothetical protein
MKKCHASHSALKEKINWCLIELLGPKKEAPKQVEVQEDMLEGFMGNDFGRILQGTQNFSLLGFLWESSTRSKENI